MGWRGRRQVEQKGTVKASCWQETVDVESACRGVTDQLIDHYSSPTSIASADGISATEAAPDASIPSPASCSPLEDANAADTTSAAYLNKLGAPFTGAAQIAQCYDGLKKGDFQAVVYDAPVLQYYLSNDGAGVAAAAE